MPDVFHQGGLSSPTLNAPKMKEQLSCELEATATAKRKNFLTEIYSQRNVLRIGCPRIVK